MVNSADTSSVAKCSRLTTSGQCTHWPLGCFRIGPHKRACRHQLPNRRPLGSYPHKGFSEAKTKFRMNRRQPGNCREPAATWVLI